MRAPGWAWLAAAAVAAVCAWAIVDYSKVKTVTFTVSGKESVNTNDGHEYRIYTDRGTYVIGDSLIIGRFDSADVYGRMRENHTYDCQVIGWRIPFFSAFQNIKSCEDVS